MLYRIYTENKNQQAIEKIVSKAFEGFTIFKAKGFWRLQEEKSLIIEIEAPGIGRDAVNKIAKKIKESNKQESVLVQEIKNNNWLI